MVLFCFLTLLQDVLPVFWCRHYSMYCHVCNFAAINICFAVRAVYFAVVNFFLLQLMVRLGINIVIFEIFVLLGFYAVQIGRLLPKFLDEVSIPFQGSNYPRRIAQCRIYCQKMHLLLSPVHALLSELYTLKLVLHSLLSVLQAIFLVQDCLLTKLQDCLSEFYTSLSALHALLYVYMHCALSSMYVCMLFALGGVKQSLLSVMYTLIFGTVFFSVGVMCFEVGTVRLVCYCTLYCQQAGLPYALLLYVFFRYVLFAVGTLGLSTNALRFFLILYSVLMLVLQSFVSYCFFYCDYSFRYRYCTTSCQYFTLSCLYFTLQCQYCTSC